MDAYTDDRDQCFRTLFFLILFLLFALASSGDSGNHPSSPDEYTARYEYVTGNLTVEQNAIISHTLWLPDIQNLRERVIRNNTYNSFSFLNKISDYNCKIEDKIILIQKSYLAIDQVPVCRLYYNLLSDEDDNPPFLS